MTATQPLAWLESFRLEIIDGDSIRSGGEVYRLVGFNTPESGANAGCQRERALSRAATDRLSQLVASGGIDLRRVPCACAPGTGARDSAITVAFALRSACADRTSGPP
jgi:hypothetical protein